MIIQKTNQIGKSKKPFVEPIDGKGKGKGYTAISASEGS